MPALIFPDNIAKLNAVLQRIFCKNLINEKQLGIFISRSGKNSDREFFTCYQKFITKQKIRPQPGRMPEGRPIVSDCSSESYNIVTEAGGGWGREVDGGVG